MAELILHHYEGSPYAEKIRLILGFKGLRWRSVAIPVVPPRPQLAPLTGGYRRTPVLQIGADVYCDTRCIARALDAMAPEPTLYPPGSRGLAAALSYWVEPQMFVTVAPVRFQSAEDLAMLLRDPTAVTAFVRDRTPFMAGVLDAARMPDLLPAARDHVRGYLHVLETILTEDGPYLAGERPSLADFSAYHAAWALAQPPRLATVLDPFPEVSAWMDRIARIGYGTPVPMEAAEALAVARRSEPVTAARRDPDDPLGRRPGDHVRVAAVDYGRDPVAGELVASSVDEIAIHRRDQVAGDVVQHFPRLGFEVRPETADGVMTDSEGAAA